MKNVIQETASATLPTLYGTFTLFVFCEQEREHAVLVMKSKKKRKSTLVRIHSQCLTGDTLLSLRCDCRDQLHESMKRMQKEGAGIILYLNQEGRGIGLTNKVRAYRLQEQGHDTVEANRHLGVPVDARDYKVATHILMMLGASNITLLTNNPEKVAQLTKHGITVVKTEPLEIPPNKVNLGYLATKKRRLGHRLKYV